MDLTLGIGLGPLAKPFSPLSLFAAGEQGAWYDPSDFTTMFQDSAGSTPVTAVGQSVGRILDKSGRGNHASQATAASRPVLQIDGTGKYYLAFDGVDDFLVTNTVTPGTDKAQVFVGIRKLSDAAEGLIVELGSATVLNGGFSLTHAGGSLAEKYTFRSKGTSNQYALTTDAQFNAPTTSVVTGLGDIGGANATLRVNGSTVHVKTADQGTGNYGAYPIYIGRRGGTTGPFNGRIYSLIVRYGANLTAGQISNTERAVNSKTGAY